MDATIRSQDFLAILLVVCCVAFITYLSLPPHQKDRVLYKLGHYGSQGPSEPYTTSTETDLTKTKSNNNEYVTTFPPSRHGVLEDLAMCLPLQQRVKLGSMELNQRDFERKLMGFEDDFRTCDESKYTAGGFRVSEVKALGAFPDFETLTGVPHPEPYDKFDIDSAIPRPYRPFRWSYHQTMSLTKLDPNWWIELESSYRERIKQRKALYQKDGESILAYFPGSELACKELMEMVLQYVTRRYPHYFSLADDNKTFTNHILHTTEDVTRRHPLLVLLDNIPEDFVLMIRNPENGYYYFRAGVICSSLGWNLGSKFGLRLAQIHEFVPDYKERMRFSMDRFFAKMQAEKPIQRGSWGFEVDQPLYMAPGDPREKHKESQNPDLTIDRCHLRVDWQTLRRLPLSGAIVFNYKALFTPVNDFRNEAYVPSLALKVLREGHEGILKYKQTWHTEHVVIPALQKFEKEQVEKGLIEKDWEHRTLDEAPFFPGWHDRWRAKQGFSPFDTD